MKALITGITGQDGSYLAEFLLKKGYEVVGMIRRNSLASLGNIEHLKDEVILEYGDLTDNASIVAIIKKHKPDEVYNLGAMSFVPVSWQTPKYTMDVNSIGVIRVLEAIKQFSPTTKFYQASTSEMYGKVREIPQNENTPFYPRSPYGVSKVAAYWATVNYRESYNLFAVTGTLFNHESPRRGTEFVTRKITDGVARIKLGLQDKLFLGNTESKRDWGHAKDYVRAMWMMLQQDKPVDYVIGMDDTHSIKQFCELAFSRAGLDYKKYVGVDPKFYRPAEVDILLSDSTKAREELGWTPRINFKQLVEEMVDHDMRLLEE